WLDVENLKDDDFHDIEELIEDLRSGYAKYLDGKWDEVLKTMERARPRFIERLQIRQNDVVVPSTAQPIAASGSIMRSDIVGSVDYSAGVQPLPKTTKR